MELFKQHCNDYFRTLLWPLHYSLNSVYKLSTICFPYKILCILLSFSFAAIQFSTALSQSFSSTIPSAISSLFTPLLQYVKLPYFLCHSLFHCLCCNQYMNACGFELLYDFSIICSSSLCIKQSCPSVYDEVASVGGVDCLPGIILNFFIFNLT